MEPKAIGQTRVDIGAGVIEASAAADCEPLGEAANGSLIAKANPGGLEPAAPIDPDLIWRVDEDVGHGGIAYQGLERANANELRPQGFDHTEYGGIAEQTRLLAYRGSDGGRRRRHSRRDETHPHAVDQASIGDAALRRCTGSRCHGHGVQPPPAELMGVLA
jgi:hypothetical protein